MAYVPSMQILRDLFRYVPRSEPFAVTAEAQQQTLNAAVVSAFSKPQPKGDTARKTSTMDIPTLNEQKTEPVKEDATVILAKARQHMLDRAATYDKPEGERSMLQTVKVFNAYTGRDLSESDGWLFMDVLKTVRDLTCEKPHRDSLEDKVAYGSLYAESRLRVGFVPKVAAENSNPTPTEPALREVHLTGCASFLVPSTTLLVRDLDSRNPMRVKISEAMFPFRHAFGTEAVRSLLKYASGVERIPDIPLDRMQATYDLINFVMNIPFKSHHGDAS